MPRTFSIASALALALLAAGLTAATVVHAASRTLAVNTAADGSQGPGSTCSSPGAAGACTLRAAIELANHDSGDTITVPAGTYGVSPGLGVLDVLQSMTITGAGPAATIVDGGSATDIFQVRSGTVAISGLTVRNGFDGGEGAAGTDIANDATLSLTNDVVSGGSAPSGAGGGIASDGPLTLDGVVVSGNKAGDAGGIALLGGLTATITRSTISGNIADGILVHDRDFNPVHLTGHGGGIVLGGAGGEPPNVTITESAITGNTATGEEDAESGDVPQGGGVFNFAGNLRMANDTVQGNTAAINVHGPRGQGVGGGIAQTGFNPAVPVSAARTNAPRQRLGVLVPRFQAAVQHASTPVQGAHTATTALDFVTVAGNGADLFGGISSLTGTFDVSNTIVSGNTAHNCGNPGAVTSTGYNLESADDCGFHQTGDQTKVDPLLDTLKLNAPGTTDTMALLPGSPAIDAADPHCDQGSDQRGVTRPQGPRCDIGAFEVEQASAATPVPSPPVTGVLAAAITRPGLAGGALALLVVLAALGAGAARRRGRSTRV